MGTVTVRVLPRSARTAVEVSGMEVVVRVRSAPEAGRATDEARRALATALEVAPSRVRLRSGPRSRTKTFEVEGLSTGDLEVRLRST